MFNNSTGFTMPVMPYGYGNGGGGFGGFSEGLLGLIVVLGLLNGDFGLGNTGGNKHQYATQADLQTQSIVSKLDGLTNGLSDSTYALNNAITGGFTGVQQSLCQGFNGVTTGMLQGFNGLQAQLADCCCENRAAIAQVRYDMATQACDTRHAIQDSTRQILDFLTTDKISALQAENASLKQNAFFNAALDARTAEIIRRTGNDCPIPAYVVQPPAQVTFPISGCGTFAGYGGGCGCGC